MAGSAEKLVRVEDLPERRVESYSVPFNIVEGSETLRLDATFYNPKVAEALAELRDTKMELRPLRSLTNEIFLPPRCRRIYVDPEHGVPFLQGSHVVHYRPADLKFVSQTEQPHIDKLIVRSGWLLITRSGTVGRCVVVPDVWDGWAASEHVIRVIPDNEKASVGYLYSFLSSSHGQAQLTAQIYGGVVDELSEEQAGSVLVPIATTLKQREWMSSCSRYAAEALELKARSMLLDQKAINLCQGFVKQLDAAPGGHTGRNYRQAPRAEQKAAEDDIMPLETPPLKPEAHRRQPKRRN
jgi:type I restriction enzyme S subunit